MSSTARMSDRRGAGIEGRLWRSWARQADAVAVGMATSDTAFRAGLDILTTIAPEAGATKLAAVAGRARLADRRHASHALRLALRADDERVRG